MRRELEERNDTRYSIRGIALQTLFHHGTYKKTYKFLKKSQFWSKDRLEKYQFQELCKLLHQAYENVPYYTKIFDNLNLKPEDIKSVEDLQKLPYLTRKDIKENIEDLKATNYPKSKFELSWTGGSTGKLLLFYIEKGVWMSQLMAYARIQMEWSGHSLFDKGVQISGDEKPFKYQLFRRTLVLSSFFMNNEYLPIFIEKIQKLKPKYIRGYPSALTNLAKYIKKNNFSSFPSVKSIVCYAETLYDWQREFLEDTFNCHVYDRYGLRETAAIGGTCDNTNYFHMFPQYGILELIGKDGKPVTKEDEVGEIVGTGFHTHIFPIIRYRTGDLGVYTNKKCTCGRNYPLLKKIQGREQELVVLKSKQLMPLTGIYGLVEMSSPNVNEYQYHQEKEGELILNIVKTQDFSEKDSQEIKENFKKRFDNDFNLTIQFVDDIPLTRRGKHKLLIQKLPIKFAP